MKKLILVVAAVGVLSIGACKKETASSGGAAGNPAGAIAAATGGKVSPLGLLPAQSDVVFALNVKEITSNPLWEMGWKQVETQVAAGQGDITPAQFAILKACMTGLSGASLYIGAESEKKSASIVATGVNKSGLQGCLDAAKPEMEKEGVSAAINGDLLTVTGKTPEDSGEFLFLDDNTLLFAVKDEKPLKADELRALAKQPEANSLAGSAGFKGLAGSIDVKKPIWFTVTGKPLEEMGGALGGSQPQHLAGSLSFGDGLDLNAIIRFADADTSAKAKAFIDEQLKSAGAMIAQFATITIGNKGNDTTVAVKVTGEQLKQLQALAGSFGQ
ncbi:MAG: hypothetical protein IPL79_01510 [Myxococcales bacterium]|nr:hypothetical protein [Myxococcales bacterium]